MNEMLDPVAAQRPRLFGLAYRMLGSAAQAEDVVQEAFVRWYAQPRTDVRNQAAFLSTVVTRLCLDQLRSARMKREHYPGPWLPEPIAVEPNDLHAEAWPQGVYDSAETELERLQSISLAFLTLLETLTPLERAVYLLHAVFDYHHAEVAAIVGRNEAACRQVYHRARRSLHSRQPATASPERHREMLHAFLAACRNGGLDELMRLLADDVVSRADGGGKVTAASRPVLGARAVARLYLGLARRLGGEADVRVHAVNGWPTAVAAHAAEGLRAVIQLHTDGERIDAIHVIVNPDKLARLARARIRSRDPAALT